MIITVTCRCAVPRQVDTDKVGSWRLRCKTCQEILWDPQAPPPSAPQQAPPITTDEEDSQFQDWLQGSAELKVMMSSEDDPGQNRCRKHPKYPIIAACTRCEKLLCKKCLDRVGDEFTCSECVSEQLAGKKRKKKGAGGGLLGFFRRLFGAKT